jgi:hypothetical protein
MRSPSDRQQATSGSSLSPASETAAIASISTKATPALAAVGPRSTTRPAIQLPSTPAMPKPIRAAAMRPPSKPATVSRKAAR